MGVLDNLKIIGEVLKEAGKIDLYKQLSEVSLKHLELQDENAKLKTKIMELEEKLKNKDELIPINNAYWNKSDNDGPFCMRCWDEYKLLMHMINNNNILYRCPRCNYDVQGPDATKLVAKVNESSKRRAMSYAVGSHLNRRK